VSEEAMVADQLDASEGMSSIAVSKALQLLNAFNGVGEECGVSELARRAELPKSTAHRLLAQLTQSEWVIRVGNKYRLSLHVYELGNRTLEPRLPGIRETTGPYLGDLFLQFRHPAHLAVLNGTDVLYLDKLEGRGAPRVPTRVGGQFPATATAVGKAMLAFSGQKVLQQVAARGFPRMTRNTITAAGVFLEQLRKAREEQVAYDLQESALGIACVAAPILVEGKPAAAISVSAPSSRLNPKAIAPVVTQAAQAISEEITRNRQLLERAS
jgi:IclR family transcriptional regulator, KDG regulon repressor